MNQDKYQKQKQKVMVLKIKHLFHYYLQGQITLLETLNYLKENFLSTVNNQIKFSRIKKLV
jgi:hypothetical protein